MWGVLFEMGSRKLTTNLLRSVYCCVFSVLVTCQSNHFLFFFQAEDGIRDIGVTGDQTCALPISRRRSSMSASYNTRSAPRSRASAFRVSRRSEERRVGKACRSRWLSYD